MSLDTRTNGGCRRIQASHRQRRCQPAGLRPERGNREGCTGIIWAGPDHTWSSDGMWSRLKALPSPERIEWVGGFGYSHAVEQSQAPKGDWQCLN
jgi:hypothetical protein